MTKPADRWHVFGLGRAGAPFCLALHQRGLLAATWTRSEAGRERARALGIPTPSDSRTIADDITHVLVALPDDVITRFCASLDTSERSVSARVWLHTSGSLDASAFRLAGIQGHAGSCHPLHSMTGAAEDLLSLNDAFFAVEGDGPALDAATSLAEWVGGAPHVLRGQDKVAYHSAAVLASNGVYALLHAATRITQSAGIASTALERSLARLAQQSAGNALKAGIQSATTGPVVRGDAGTVRTHLEHLRTEANAAAESTEAFYREVARELLLIAEAGATRHAAVTAIAAVLEEGER